jgi:hypothetical protein
MIEPGLRLIGSSIKHSPSKLFPLNHSVHSMRPLTLQSINPALLKVEYAVRGELAIKAEKYRVELKEGNKSLPFKKVISSNIGNPQQKGLDQPPITFTRQVRSIMFGVCASWLIGSIRSLLSQSGLPSWS